MERVWHEEAIYQTNFYSVTFYDYPILFVAKIWKKMYENEAMLY